MAKQDFTALINKAKETKIETPVQKVIPIKEKKEETIFSFYIPTNKLKKLKLLSAEKGISLKELINNAIDKEYFQKKSLGYILKFFDFLLFLTIFIFLNKIWYVYKTLIIIVFPVQYPYAPINMIKVILCRNIKAYTFVLLIKC